MEKTKKKDAKEENKKEKVPFLSIKFYAFEVRDERT